MNRVGRSNGVVQRERGQGGVGIQTKNITGGFGIDQDSAYKAEACGLSDSTGSSYLGHNRLSDRRDVFKTECFQDSDRAVLQIRILRPEARGHQDQAAADGCQSD